MIQQQNMSLRFLPIWFAMLGGGFLVLRLGNGLGAGRFAVTLLGALIVGIAMGYGLTSFIPSRHFATVAMWLVGLLSALALIVPPWSSNLGLIVNLIVGTAGSLLGHVVARNR